MLTQLTVASSQVSANSGLFTGSSSRLSSGETHDNGRRGLGPQLWPKKCLMLGFGKPEEAWFTSKQETTLRECKKVPS